ncbi:binding-protein-dependent transport systems inner membrane component [Beutenbergia cavernae DSM 12333]|uniref:Binding-protein-dependent transport systems inner membrane component n=1 Tax=Beutenbergia cavernae (strain ATCC BAA-8 / DSM 12333 / CCUG 43141 / JCM 11478 / NBRC 16432 / NCIMB 13614 / HKI 0122) TaxID=471853 RepID=C5C3D7_BEUC1|nr:carbohydrate ABC transporter permease [Beutenbergia cavernae]ACQ79836.1 binding-protein-dependent transport systems inner membrane component [Beutenbergia cavernae DSM 12333]
MARDVTASSRPVWKEKPSVLLSSTKAVVVAVTSVLILIPMLVVVSTSLASEEQILEAGGYVLWPTDPTLEAYEVLFRGPFMVQAIGVSVFVTVVGTAIALFTTITMAYALSRPVLFGRPVLLAVLFTLLFAPGLIPMFLMVRQLNLLDTVWSLILPGALGAFNFVVMRSFFQAIPRELTEAAHMDGASDFYVLRRVVLPLSKAVVAVVGLFYAVGFWNAFFNALLYIQRRTDLYPVQVILRSYVIRGDSLTADQLGVEQVPPPQSLQMAIVMVALVPILLVYPFLQRHFTKGVITGAVKG